MMEFQNIETVICFNKTDIGDDDYMNQLQTIYQKAGYKVMFASATEEQGVDEIKKNAKRQKYRVCRTFRSWKIINA